MWTPHSRKATKIKAVMATARPTTCAADRCCHRRRVFQPEQVDLLGPSDSPALASTWPGE